MMTESDPVVPTPIRAPFYTSLRRVKALRIAKIGNPNDATDGSRLLAFYPEFEPIFEPDRQGQPAIDSRFMTELPNHFSAYQPDCLCVDAEWMIRHRPVVGGYLVIHRDGYKTFVPENIFKDTYEMDAPQRPS